MVESRYSLIQSGSRPEEIVLLQGRGCFWRKCRFCNYYLDTGTEDEILETNREVLSRITGETGRLTVLNSGSFFELPEETLAEIIEICRDKGITDLSLEAHWRYRDRIRDLREVLRELGIRLHARIGIETFDEAFREDILKKGFSNPAPEEIARIFDECCLLFGIKGQTLERLEKDLAIAQEYFEDIYLNIYEEVPGLEADGDLVTEFIREIYPKLSDERVHVLINNTDLGVG